MYHQESSVSLCIIIHYQPSICSLRYSISLYLIANCCFRQDDKQLGTQSHKRCVYESCPWDLLRREVQLGQSGGAVLLCLPTRHQSEWTSSVVLHRIVKKQNKAGQSFIIVLGLINKDHKSESSAIHAFLRLFWPKFLTSSEQLSAGPWTISGNIWSTGSGSKVAG